MKDKKEKVMTYENIKFSNVALPRYMKVKESIEGLMAIIDGEKVKEDGTDRVLTALLQLIDENDDKTVNEKQEDIKDAIYNGNVFSHYFEEDAREQAVEVLSKTSLLNDEERFIYIVNFYMPGDKRFSTVYSECGKNIEKIIKYYGLADNANSHNFVYGRILEISTFFKEYNEEKNRQKLLLETQILAAMKDVMDNPNEEDIEKVRNMVVSLPNQELKSTLMEQLTELEATLVEETPVVSKQPAIDPKALKAGFASLSGDAPYVPELAEEVEPEEEQEPEEIPVVEDTKVEIEVGEPVEVEPAEEVEEEKIEEVPVVSGSEDSVIEEPKPLETTDLKVPTVEPMVAPVGEDVAKDVMTQLQSLVSGAKQSSARVAELEALLTQKDMELEAKAKEIEGLQKRVDENSDLLVERDAMIQTQSEQIREQGARISLLEEDVREKEAGLIEAGKLVAQKDMELEAKEKEIGVITSTAESYKKSLTEIQTFLVNNANPTMSSEEKGEKTI